MYTALITAKELKKLLGSDTPLRIIDTRFSLEDPQAGRRAYDEAHLPEAIYAHLDEDLSGEIRPGETGRHPLPDRLELAAQFGTWGIDERTQVVVYDDKGGAIASRLWWLLRWLGHDRVAVLDGGLTGWRESGGKLTWIVPDILPRTFVPDVREHLIVAAERVDAIRQDEDYRLVDSRAAPRYHGEEEPIDPVAGHIPGAENLPFADNLRAGVMRPKAELRERFGSTDPERTVFYCGSGVTACHNLLAHEYAGLGLAKLYPGSWSEWIIDPSREISKS
jgi:thiosulfate/3-mercaptopyruvate sulfurtransferase